MTNGIISDAEFENEIRDMSDRQLSEFAVRQILAQGRRVLDVCGDIADVKKRVVVLENGDRKVGGIAGAVSGGLIGILIGVLDYFLKPRA